MSKWPVDYINAYCFIFLLLTGCRKWTNISPIAQFSVLIGYLASSHAWLSCGIPQGSVLGTLRHFLVIHAASRVDCRQTLVSIALQIICKSFCLWYQMTVTQASNCDCNCLKFDRLTLLSEGALSSFAFSLRLSCSSPRMIMKRQSASLKAPGLTVVMLFMSESTILLFLVPGWFKMMLLAF